VFLLHVMVHVRGFLIQTVSTVKTVKVISVVKGLFIMRLWGEIIKMTHHSKSLNDVLLEHMRLMFPDAFRNIADYSSDERIKHLHIKFLTDEVLEDYEE